MARSLSPVSMADRAEDEGSDAVDINERPSSAPASLEQPFATGSDDHLDRRTCDDEHDPSFDIVDETHHRISTADNADAEYANHHDTHKEHVHATLDVPTLHESGVQKPKKKMKKVKRLVKKWRRVPEQQSNMPHQPEAVHEVDSHGFEYRTAYQADLLERCGTPRGDGDFQHAASPHAQLHQTLQFATHGAGYAIDRDGHLQENENYHYPPATAQFDPEGQTLDYRAYDNAPHPSSDAADYLDAARRKIERDHLKESSRWEGSNAKLQNQLQDEQNANLALQNRLDATEQDKTQLSSKLEQERTTLTNFKLKAARYRTFVDGLGNDIESLKREANSHRIEGEQLAADASKWQETQETLLKEKANSAEKSGQLTNEALTLCQTVKTELATANIRLTHLQQDLNDKAKLLAEERDLRTQLESQRQDATSVEALVRDVKATVEAILEKQHDMDATKEDADRQNTSDMLEKTMAAIQNLNSTQNSAADDVQSVKGLVEALSEKYVIRT